MRNFKFKNLGIEDNYKVKLIMIIFQVLKIFKRYVFTNYLKIKKSVRRKLDWGQSLYSKLTLILFKSMLIL